MRHRGGWVAGRPRKPTALRELQGNPGKRPLPTHEPKPRRELPKPPTHLNTAARREWKRVSGELYEMGLLTVVDRAALAAYCVVYARWEEAEKKLAVDGYVVMTPNGYPVQSAWLQISNKALQQMAKFQSEFGMTPASRAKVTAVGEEEEDPFEAFVKGKLGDDDDDDDDDDTSAG